MITKTMEYLQRLPKPGTIPAGQVLVHNQVYPVARRMGVRGSRAWLEPPGASLEACPCDWAPELGQHYRVKR